MSTHLRQQKADLLHLLQRQQRVADRVLEKHVQQHLKRQQVRQSKHRSHVCPAASAGKALVPADAPAQTQAQTTASDSPATHNHSSPWRSLRGRLALRRARSGARNQAPEATPPSRRPIRGRGRYLPSPRKGSPGVVRPAGRGLGRERPQVGLFRCLLPHGCLVRAGRNGPSRLQNGLERRFSG